MSYRPAEKMRLCDRCDASLGSTRLRKPKIGEPPEERWPSFKRGEARVSVQWVAFPDELRPKHPHTSDLGDYGADYDYCADCTSVVAEVLKSINLALEKLRDQPVQFAGLVKRSPLNPGY